MSIWNKYVGQALPWWIEFNQPNPIFTKLWKKQTFTQVNNSISVFFVIQSGSGI